MTSIPVLLPRSTDGEIRGHHYPKQLNFSPLQATSSSRLCKFVCVRELGKSCHPRSALLVFHPRIIVSPPDRQFDRLLKRHAGKK